MTLITWYPDLAEDLHKLTDRLVDLLSIVRKNGIITPICAARGRSRTCCPQSHRISTTDSLGDVQDGSAAGTAYLQIINPETDPAERQRLVCESVWAYCKRDTLALVELVTYLSKGVPPTSTA